MKSALRLKNGSLLEIKLPQNYGFAYGRYLDSIVYDNREVFLSAVKVYNYIAKDPILDFSKLKESDLLFGYRKIAGILPTLRKGLWKVVGQNELSKDELEIPDFKAYYPGAPFIERNAEKWYVIKENSTRKSFEVPREHVQHLERFNYHGTGLVEIRIIMEHLRANGKSIEDYFKLDEYYEKALLDEVLSRPIYNQIPLEMRGKAISNEG